MPNKVNNSSEVFNAKEDANDKVEAHEAQENDRDDTLVCNELADTGDQIECDAMGNEKPGAVDEDNDEPVIDDSPAADVPANSSLPDRELGSETTESRMAIGVAADEMQEVDHRPLVNGHSDVGRDSPTADGKSSTTESESSGEQKSSNVISFICPSSSS